VKFGECCSHQHCKVDAVLEELNRFYLLQHLLALEVKICLEEIL